MTVQVWPVIFFFPLVDECSAWWGVGERKKSRHFYLVTLTSIPLDAHNLVRKCVFLSLSGPKWQQGKLLLNADNLPLLLFLFVCQGF